MLALLLVQGHAASNPMCFNLPHLYNRILSYLVGVIVERIEITDMYKF